MDRIGPLQRTLRVSFGDPALLQRALVHSSYLNEHPEWVLGSNEGLEFLGDAVIGLAVAQELFIRSPQLSEGQLTAFRAALVRGESLAGLAGRLQLGLYLALGAGEEASGGRQRDSNLAAAFEALVGAILLDRGFPAAQRFVLRCLRPELNRLTSEGWEPDPKSLLQELAQSQGRGTPVYRTVGLQGPDNARRFTVEVVVGGEVLGVGEGPRKVEAQRAAARQALEAAAVGPPPER